MIEECRDDGSKSLAEITLRLTAKSSRGISKRLGSRMGRWKIAILIMLGESQRGTTELGANSQEATSLQFGINLVPTLGLFSVPAKKLPQ